MIHDGNCQRGGYSWSIHSIAWVGNRCTLFPLLFSHRAASLPVALARQSNVSAGGRAPLTVPAFLNITSTVYASLQREHLPAWPCYLVPFLAVVKWSQSALTLDGQEARRMHASRVACAFRWLNRQSECCADAADASGRTQGFPFGSQIRDSHIWINCE